MAIEVQGVAPIVQVFDMPRSIRFYRDVLGFMVTGRSRAKSADPDDVDWVMMKLSNATVMLNTAYDRRRTCVARSCALVGAPGHLPLLWLSRRGGRIPSSGFEGICRRPAKGGLVWDEAAFSQGSRWFRNLLSVDYLTI